MAKEPITESDIGDRKDGAPAKEADQDILERALGRFDTVAPPQAELRAQSLEARRFCTIPGAMWEGSWSLQFENMPRPEVDKITKALEKIETDYRENRITVDFIPASDDADEDTAELLDGLHRADSYHFKSMQARDNALQEGIRGGFGAWRLTTDYADPYDPSSESQRINPALVIVDADQSVYFDPASKLYDKSDAMWAFVVTADPREAACEKWGDGIAPWPLDGWKYTYDWYTPSVVRIAEYYEVQLVPDKLLVLTNSTTGEERRFFESELDAKEISDQQAQGWKVTRSPIKRRRVHKYILSGSALLEDCGYIAGPNIPIVPFYGRRDFVDNMERWRGYVGKKMDRQRIYNASIAKVVELQSLAPYEVPIVDPDQVDPVILDQWARANIDRTPLRLLKALRQPDGQIVQNGPVGKVEPPQVQPATAALLQITSADLTDDDDTTDQVKSNVSADAMDIATTRIDAKSAIYLDNMRQSVQREAEIYLGMSSEIYYEPGRSVETQTMDGQDGRSQLLEPVRDDNGVFRIRNDLTRGRYKVVADVQESTATKRQKTVNDCMNGAQAAAALQDQDLGQVFLLTAVMNQDGEGMQDIQKYARHRLIALGVVQPTPEEQQQIQQAQQAQGQGQPSPSDQALMAQAGSLQSQAQLNAAKSVQTLADAKLKDAQAEALGGPDKAPEVPTGLSAANDFATNQDKLASAALKSVQAVHLQHDMGLKSNKQAHEQSLAERQQRSAEQQQQAPQDNAA